MEENIATNQPAGDYLYQYATNLLVNGKKNPAEVERLLILKGLDAANASLIVREMEGPIRDAKKAHAKKDMLHGGLWCAGGLALTLADVGFIFWGAILFGGFQFLKGVVNLK